MPSEQPSLETILGHYNQDRENLIPLLQEVQEQFQYLSPETVTAVANHLDLSRITSYNVCYTKLLRLVS